MTGWLAGLDPQPLRGAARGNPPDIPEILVHQRPGPLAAERSDDVRHGVRMADDQRGQRAGRTRAIEAGRVGGS